MFCQKCGSAVKKEEQPDMGSGINNQDIFISPRTSTGDITQIQNLNVQDMSEDKFREICVKLNTLLRNAGVPAKLDRKSGHEFTIEQQRLVDTVLEKLKQADKRFSKAIGDPELLIRLGNTEKLTGTLPVALALYQKALELYLEKGDATDIANCHNLVGETLHRLREFGPALEEFRSALRLAEELEDLGLMAESMKLMAKTHFVRSEYEKAVRLYFRAWGYRRKAKKLAKAKKRME